MYKFVDRYMQGARIFWSDVRKLQLSCIWAVCNFGRKCINLLVDICKAHVYLGRMSRSCD